MVLYVRKGGILEFVGTSCLVYDVLSPEQVVHVHRNMIKGFIMYFIIRAQKGDGPFDITDFDITESESTNLI